MRASDTFNITPSGRKEDGYKWYRYYMKDYFMDVPIARGFYLNICNKLQEDACIGIAMEETLLYVNI